jgi:hypothetical protein
MEGGGRARARERDQRVGEGAEHKKGPFASYSVSPFLFSFHCKYTSEAQAGAFVHAARLSAGKPSTHEGLPVSLLARGVATDPTRRVPCCAPCPTEPPAATRVSWIPPPPPPVSSFSDNGLGAEGATALSSGLTHLTKLQSIDVR